MAKSRANIHIWIKNQGKEKVLLEVIQAYEACYPQKFAFYRQALKDLRSVTIGSHKDLKGRTVDINLRVPTEPWLFLQSIIPGFGKDSDDVALLCKVWEDFAVAKVQNKRIRRNLVLNNLQLEPKAAANGPEPQDRDCPADEEPDPCICGDDREGLRGHDRRCAGVDQQELPA